MRIVSLLPSATELLFALGAGDEVVGVTFECDHPPEARQRRVVSTTTMPQGLAPREIDDWVRAAAAAGEDLYRLDADALAGLDADLVVTQDLCAVCAVDVGTVDDALTHLGCHADVLTLDPQTLEDVLDSVLVLGARVDRASEAAALVADARARLGAVARAVAGRPRPRVLVLEWTDPPYSPGHWLPDLVTAAGGVPALGQAGARSRAVGWDDVAACDADVVVVAPCGFGLDDAVAMADGLVAADRLPDVPVWAADANATWTRPSLRLVDAVEDLAAALHPDALAPRPGSMAAVRSRAAASG